MNTGDGLKKGNKIALLVNQNKISVGKKNKQSEWFSNAKYHLTIRFKPKQD